MILQGDPDFARYERRDRFAWLRFSRGDTSRDGFLELKRSLVKAAELFRGPVIVIHQSDTPIPRGFRIDQPLRNDKGAVVANLTRIAIGLKKPQSQWLEVESDFAWRPPFRVRVRDVTVPKSMTPGQAAPGVSASSSTPGRRRRRLLHLHRCPALKTTPPGLHHFSSRCSPCNQLQQIPPARQPDTGSGRVCSATPMLNLNSPANLPPILPVPASGASGTGQ